MPDMILWEWGSNSGHPEDSDCDPTPLDQSRSPILRADLDSLLINRSFYSTRNRSCTPSYYEDTEGGINKNLSRWERVATNEYGIFCQ